MSQVFKHVDYSLLNSRQRESYNFQKVSAVLADFGFSTIRLSDDWESADFIAQHLDGHTFLKVQLKGRVTFDRKYLGKDIYVACPHGANWYLYPHDAFLEMAMEQGGPSLRATILDGDGNYHWSTPPAWLALLLEPYRLVDRGENPLAIFGE